jgi:hypothetical protein
MNNVHAPSTPQLQNSNYQQQQQRHTPAPQWPSGTNVRMLPVPMPFNPLPIPAPGLREPNACPGRAHRPQPAHRARGDAGPAASTAPSGD